MTAPAEAGGHGRTVAGAVALLVILAIALALFQSGDDDQAFLSPRSTEPDGGKALVDLLAELDHPVELSQNVPNGADADVVLVLEEDISADQLAALEGWVERGGRAVVVLSLIHI